MKWRNSTEAYGAVPQTMHWVTVALVSIAWFIGQFDDLFGRGAAQAAVLSIHISTGLAVLGLVFARLLWRASDSAPVIEHTVLGAWLDGAGLLTHYLLYALLLVVPVAGIILQFARGDSLPLFGLTEIVSPWAPDRAFARSLKQIHEISANALVIIASLHAAAALVHHWVFRDRTLSRMLPPA